MDREHIGQEKADLYQIYFGNFQHNLNSSLTDTHLADVFIQSDSHITWRDEQGG